MFTQVICKFCMKQYLPNFRAGEGSVCTVIACTILIKEKMISLQRLIKSLPLNKRRRGQGNNRKEPRRNTLLRAGSDARFAWVSGMSFMPHGSCLCSHSQCCCHFCASSACDPKNSVASSTIRPPVLKGRMPLKSLLSSSSMGNERGTAAISACRLRKPDVSRGTSCFFLWNSGGSPAPPSRWRSGMQP